MTGACGVISVSVVPCACSCAVPCSCVGAPSCVDVGVGTDAGGAFGSAAAGSASAVAGTDDVAVVVIVAVASAADVAAADVAAADVAAVAAADACSLALRFFSSSSSSALASSFSFIDKSIPVTELCNSDCCLRKFSNFSLNGFLSDSSVYLPISVFILCISLSFLDNSSFLTFCS